MNELPPSMEEIAEAEAILPREPDRTKRETTMLWWRKVSRILGAALTVGASAATIFGGFNLFESSNKVLQHLAILVLGAGGVGVYLSALEYAGAKRAVKRHRMYKEKVHRAKYQQATPEVKAAA